MKKIERIAILGSSIALGHSSSEYGVGEYAKELFGVPLTKECVSGTTMSSKAPNSYIERMIKNMDKNEHFDMFICQLSTNDQWWGFEFGEIAKSCDLSDIDSTTITGAIEYIILYVKKTWNLYPVFFTSNRISGDIYKKMVDRLHELEKKYPITVIDLYSDDEFNDISDEERSIYMADSIHPTKEGYVKWWGPVMKKYYIEYFKRNGYEIPEGLE